MKLKEISETFGMDATMVKAYFQACANLYGICTLRRAMLIINKQNPQQKITEEQILAFAAHCYGQWRIVRPADLNDPMASCDPMRQEIVHQMLIIGNDYTAYDRIRGFQADKDYYIPNKTELLKYARRQFYYERTPYTEAFAALLRDTLHREDWEDLLEETVCAIRADDFEWQDLAEELGSTVPNIDVMRQVGSVCADLQNNSRMISNRGFTPTEMRRIMGTEGQLPQSISFGPGMQAAISSGEMDANEMIRGFAGMDIPNGLKMNLMNEVMKAKQAKPDRNDPCPCGSGKKYKKCCGRLN